MTWIALIRHAPTAWNAERRIQGRADVRLSEEGRAMAKRWRPPQALDAARWVSSPLSRAQETAQLMGVARFSLEPRLVEMDWGRWEGQRLAELRDGRGEEMAANEARGLDFRPEGGESPREVQGRLVSWLADVAEGGRPMAAVTHKGVIRAVYARAAAWDMTGPPPTRLAWDRAHVFSLDATGAPSVARLNLPLVQSEAA